MHVTIWLRHGENTSPVVYLRRYTKNVLILSLCTWYKWMVSCPGGWADTDTFSRLHRIQQEDTWATDGSPVIVLSNCANAPVINFPSSAIRQALDGLQRGTGPIHAKWVRGVNLCCLQRLKHFPFVPLSLSASDRLSKAQLRKANNIQHCCSLYCPLSFFVQHIFTFLLVPASPTSFPVSRKGHWGAHKPFSFQCTLTRVRNFKERVFSRRDLGLDSSRSLTVCGSSLTDIASWPQFATWLTGCDLKVCDRWCSHTWLTVTIKHSLIQIKHAIYFGRKAIGFFSYLFTPLTERMLRIVGDGKMCCGTFSGGVKKKKKNANTQLGRGSRTWTVKNCKCKFTSSEVNI